MSGDACESVWLSLLLSPSDRSPAGSRSYRYDFESDSQAAIDAYESDLEWFRGHVGEQSRIRPRIYGEFDFIEDELPPYSLVESSLLPDGRLSRRPIFWHEVQ